MPLDLNLRVATLTAATLLLALVTLALSAGPAAAAVFVAQAGEEEARSPQEERRRKLLEGMGLRKQAEPAPAPAARVPSTASAPGDAAAAKATTPAGEMPSQKPQSSPKSPPATAPGLVPPATASSHSPSFRRVIHPLMLQTCKACHVVGGAAAMTSFVLSGEADADHRGASRMTDVRAPASSALLMKAAGQTPHAGGATWPPGSPAYGRVLAWIQSGAQLDGDHSSSAIAIATVAVGSKEAPRRTVAVAPNAAAEKPSPTSTVDSKSGPVETLRPATTATVLPAETVVATGAAVTPGAPPAANDTVDFATAVHPMLVRVCIACHTPMGPAATTRLVLANNVDGDYTKVRALVNLQTPERSALITKSIGEAHAGGAFLVAGSADYLLLVNWVAAGALRRATATADVQERASANQAAASPTGMPEASDAATTQAIPQAVPLSAPLSAPPSAPPSAHPVSKGFVLPYGLALNGRFDLAYERGAFNGNPASDAAINALRSYHHFLFLSRESADDPVGLVVEMLSLQFWEAHYRWRASSLPIQVVIAAGKIIVPFGAEPLLHQSYGGLAGFDQRILPAIWAQNGLAVRALAHRRELSITDDFFVVRGYALRQADAILNLQNDFSPEDDVRIGWGNRLGLAWGPLSGWYSIFYNPLGFGRRLFMQAADLTLSRVRQIPVLGHFSFGAGVIRADVAGGGDTGAGGPGKDYYHFGSYLQIRYHPSDWLYFQYRQGLRTFNNRRGVTVDKTRLTSADGSGHNFGVVARHRGLTAGLYYFINLEKVDEIPDDFFRASLTYDF